MAIYDTAYIGTASNRVTFNDYNNSPLFRILATEPQRRDMRELDIPIPFESGVSDYQTLVGKMAYVIEGRMYPADEAEHHQGIRSLRKLASLEVSQDDNNSDVGYVPYVWTEQNGIQKQVYLKVRYVDLRQDTRQGLSQDFRLICKVKDPTIKSADLVTASSQGFDVTTSSGSAIHGFEYPIVYGASSGSVDFTGNNQGDLDAYPEAIVINGPVNQPRITNTTTGQYIEISENLATSSNQIVINYDKDNLYVEKDGVSVVGSVTTASSYFKMVPGINEFALTGSSIGADAYARVTFYSAWPLS